ncbi:hypothetical protein COU56_01000 [Candidatus Pacearchaeota archaeon CG10_big_fil_rev_8_21_14_0_10_31_9]|nr:MAG: hypothetical protein AUJ62_01765 [Candidatus Pacearchaeota archaeon CG1_02_32_21]PIN95647.1 MAG: hypothetical protein COU56_01000 [Candidatus Pacearchaeota archaeon CG10_big_fil_rev_8_21_14_0_10_31_9]PIZ83949.1 MAG: hypothetical protein COX97_00105 [Candidatus Pacearchaeota archaeon CG_4_10_14_0_2_um_filter_05_32_18]
MKTNRDISGVEIEKSKLVRALRQVPNRLSNEGIKVDAGFQEKISYFVKYFADALENSGLPREEGINPEIYAFLYNTALETLIPHEDDNGQEVYSGDLEKLYEAFDLVTETIADYALGEKYNGESFSHRAKEYFSKLPDFYSAHEYRSKLAA